MVDENGKRPKARVTRVGDQDGPSRRLHIEWPPGGETEMVTHQGAFTVVYSTAGKIRREIEMPDGTVQSEEQEVEAGTRYARPAGTRQRVINLSGHALDADKDEERPGDNPDDTKVESDPPRGSKVSSA